MLQALRQIHSKTLQTLSITTNKVIERAVIEEINLLLESCTNLTTSIDLAWLDMTVDPIIIIINNLPPSIRHLGILTQNQVSARHFLANLAGRVPPLQNLMSVHFFLYNDDDVEEQESGVVHTIGLEDIRNGLRDRGIPWLLGWRYWDPVPLTY